MTTPARRTRRNQRGAAAIELIGVLPVLFTVAMMALQVGIVGWTVTATSDAAWAAARAASLNDSPSNAARAALPGSLRMANLTGGRVGNGFRYTVSVAVPSLIGIELGVVNRTAEVPAIR